MGSLLLGQTAYAPTTASFCLQALSSNPVHLQPLSAHEPLQLQPLPSLAVQHSHAVQQPIYTTVHNTVAVTASGPVYIPEPHTIVKQAGYMFRFPIPTMTK